MAEKAKELGWQVASLTPWEGGCLGNLNNLWIDSRLGLVDIVVVWVAVKHLLRLHLLLHHGCGLGHKCHILHARINSLYECLRGNWHVNHSGLQVGRLRDVNRLRLVNSARGGIDLRLSNTLFVLDSDLALVIFDSNPSKSLLSGVLENIFWLGDLAIFEITERFSSHPDSIKAPSARALDEDSHSPSVTDS